MIKNVIQSITKTHHHTHFNNYINLLSNLLNDTTKTKQRKLSHNFKKIESEKYNKKYIVKYK